MNNPTKIGLKVRKSFKSPFEELKFLRRAVGFIMKDYDYKSMSKEEKAYYDEFMDYNDKVEKVVEENK